MINVCRKRENLKLLFIFYTISLSSFVSCFINLFYKFSSEFDIMAVEITFNDYLEIYFKDEIVNCSEIHFSQFLPIQVGNAILKQQY